MVVAGGVLVLFRVTLHTSGSFGGQNQLLSSSGIKIPNTVVVACGGRVAVSAAIVGVEADIETVDFCP